LHSERRDKKLKHVYSESTAYEGNWRKQAITLIDLENGVLSVMAIYRQPFLNYDPTQFQGTPGWQPQPRGSLTASLRKQALCRLA
jgi:hypothetical protein